MAEREFEENQRKERAEKESQELKKQQRASEKEEEKGNQYQKRKVLIPWKTLLGNFKTFLLKHFTNYVKDVLKKDIEKFNW